MEISCRVYTPRRPRKSPLFRLVEQHLEELPRIWPTRFVKQLGPLNPVVERVLRVVGGDCSSRAMQTVRGPSRELRSREERSRPVRASARG